MFSPEGRLFQVEYAMEAIGKAGSCVGILARDGVVLAAEKKVTSKLLDSHSVGVRWEKMYKIDDHVACAIAGMTADANILINMCRLATQKYLYTYQVPMPLEQLVRLVCDIKHGYTQHGGLRVFGVSLLLAGWDSKHGFQLYQSDPSGNYGGWKATAMGSNFQAAISILKRDYKETVTVSEAVKSILKIMTDVVEDTTRTRVFAEKIELAALTRDEAKDKVILKIYGTSELQGILGMVNEEMTESDHKDVCARA